MTQSTAVVSPGTLKQNQGSPFSPQRIASVDAYRGFVMLLMMAEVLSFRHVSESLPGSSFWRFMYFHQDHVPWVGCSLHDLIQPSFSFLVGVALPFSIASRMAKGAAFSGMLLSAIKRSLILIFLGIFLRSMWSSQTYFTFEDTLTQIGLGYPFLFLLGFASKRIQIAALAVILIGYWAAFALYTAPPEAANPALTGVPIDWEYNLRGFADHWNKNRNLAWDVDRWFLNLFPREKPFLFNEGGYSTLSFIPTLGTMILGLVAGNILRRNEWQPSAKAKRFVVVGVILLVASLLIQEAGINPIVKRIWTPNWVLFSGGCCFLLLSIFYWIIDIKNVRRWAFFLMVIGMNSIAAYVIADGFGAFIQKSLYIHLGQNYDQVFGDAYSTLVKGAIVLTIEWLILYWMYKRKIFIKI
jgi:predicted acyltransferase